MFRSQFLLALVVILITSCSPATATPVASPSPTPTPLPLEQSESFEVAADAILFFQDFESGDPAVVSNIPKWQVTTEADGNHVLCNPNADEFYPAAFGRGTWTDYAVEARVKSLEHGKLDDAYVTLFARMEPYTNIGYSATVNFDTLMYDLQFSEPYEGYGHRKLASIRDGEWYQIRLELTGNHIKFFINNELMISANASHRANGSASIVSSKGLKMCVDDVRVWTLDSEGQPATAKLPDIVLYASFGVYEAAYPTVMANRNFVGTPAFEYKSNCSQNFIELETCFLWDLTDVTTTTPNGQVYHLNKDFNINPYSGEVTRRWVLYGPEGSGYPVDGTYLFSYYKGDQLVFEQRLDYIFSMLTPVTDIQAVQVGNGLAVDWVPPSDISADKWYKVYVSLHRKILYSKRFEWDVSHVEMPDLVLIPGETYEIDVDVFDPDNSAGGPTFFLTWQPMP